MRVDNPSGESIQSIENILTVMGRVNEARANEKGRLYYVIDSRSGMLGVTRDANLASSDQDVTKLIMDIFKVKNDFNKDKVSSEPLNEAVIRMMAFGDVSRVAVDALKNVLQAALIIQAELPEAAQPVMQRAIGEFAREAVSTFIQMNKL